MNKYMWSIREEKKESHWFLVVLAGAFLGLFFAWVFLRQTAPGTLGDPSASAPILQVVKGDVDFLSK